MSATESTILEMLRELRAQKFFGNVQLDFRHGEVGLIRRTETIKIGEENNRHDFQTGR